MGSDEIRAPMPNVNSVHTLLSHNNTLHKQNHTMFFFSNMINAGGECGVASLCPTNQQVNYRLKYKMKFQLLLHMMHIGFVQWVSYNYLKNETHDSQREDVI